MLSRSVRIFKRWSLIEDFGLFGNNLDGVVLLGILKEQSQEKEYIVKGSVSLAHTT